MNNNINYPVWAEINLDNFYQNCINLKSNAINNAKRDIKFMAVIKADAYGHGSLECASICLKAGADYFAVAVLKEALILREVYKRIPILILGVSIHKDDAYLIVKHNLTPTITNLELAKAINLEAEKQNKIIDIHIKIDTGMGRAGLFPKDAIIFIKDIVELKNLNIQGIYTHLSSADSKDKEYSYFQKEQFVKLLINLEKIGINIPLKHISNSASTIDLQPEFSFNMIRPGVSLYGFYPSDEVDKKKLKLYPVLSLKSRVGSIKTFEKGMYISYSRTYKTTEKCKIAVIPIGYADGYSRRLSNNAEVIIKNKKYPVVGRVCMDSIMVKLPIDSEIKLYDKVILIGSSKTQTITADDIAKRIDTINYEVTCMISKRVPRIYIKNNKVIKLKDENQCIIF